MRASEWTVRWNLTPESPAVFSSRVVSVSAMFETSPEGFDVTFVSLLFTSSKAKNLTGEACALLPFSAASTAA